jgi:hypothetical protein
LVYQRTYPKSRFSQDTLAELAYAADGAPLFSTVGIDHSSPPGQRCATLHYAEQVPENFRFVPRSEEITIPA